MKDKMKKAGYAVFGFAMLLSVLMLIPFTNPIDSDIALPLVYFWAGTGVTLLFGNAGKRLGEHAIKKDNEPER